MIPTSLKILTRKELEVLLDKWRSENQMIVFTNGVFDLVHLGHVDYLEKARNLGDKLIVALNTDASVKRLKGDNRPISDEQARLHVMAAFEFVDATVLFDEDTPYELISAIKPDILVKGKDYEISNIVGADIVLENGGSVETIDIVKGYSTTSIIDKIKRTK
ncbi:MAG: D-glycero-beta-D-manno-heptose 1-phosphate adenylyltransferase [Bacteroidota bacterium]